MDQAQIQQLTKHYGGLSDYRSSEGKKVQLKYRGKIKDTIQNILGGLRSSCTYVGAPSLKQLSKCTTFVRVNQQFNDTFEIRLKSLNFIKSTHIN